MQKTKIREILKNIPVFWQMLGMTALIVLVLLVIHIVSNRVYENRLRENYLKQAQENLEHNVDAAFRQMQMTSAIPTAIEATQAYGYLKNVKYGILPIKYYSVLQPLKQALNNQIYLQGENVECLLYFKGPNTICTKRRIFTEAERCFEEYLIYENLDILKVLHELPRKEVVQLFPCEKVLISGSEQEECFTLLIRPASSNICIVSLYSAEEVLELLGFEILPEGSYVQIESMEREEMLLPCLVSNMELLENYYSITAENAYVKCKVTFYIPKTYFGEQVSSVRKLGLILTALTAVLGFILAIVFSKVQAKPIEQLVLAVDKEKRESRNEIIQLGSLFSDIEGEMNTLRNVFIYNIVAKIFSGAVITEREEQQLCQRLQKQQGAYRLAVLCARGNMHLEIPETINLSMCKDFYTVSVNEAVIGVLFPDTEACLRHLEQLQRELCQEQLIACGISAPLVDFQNSHVAVRQAYLSLPSREGIGIYAGESPNLNMLSWLHHERMYQALLTNDEKHAKELLLDVRRMNYVGEMGKDVFLNICFVIYSAAEEMAVPFNELERLKYDPAHTFGHNMDRLELLMEHVFEKMRKKHRQKHDMQQERILEYIREQCADYDICAAKVGKHFDMSEKNIYALVRQVTEMSFGEYLLSIRMKKAEKLLCSTRLSVEEIAEGCGYPVLSTFYRAFKKQYGCAPAQYRMKGQN